MHQLWGSGRAHHFPTCTWLLLWWDPLWPCMTTELWLTTSEATNSANHTTILQQLAQHCQNLAKVLPASLYSCPVLQLRINQRKPSMCPTNHTRCPTSGQSSVASPCQHLPITEHSRPILFFLSCCPTPLLAPASRPSTSDGGCHIKLRTDSLSRF